MLTIYDTFLSNDGYQIVFTHILFHLNDYMHELGIAQSIMQIVLSEAEKARARKVLKVTVKVGELAGVLPDSLTFCFNLLAKSTIAEHALLTIEKVPIRGYCSQCESEFVIADHRYCCTTCGNKHIELVSGRELQIGQLEIEDETD
jgi:hydrogenase nickel incorporation protein HypA/HybF